MQWNCPPPLLCSSGKLCVFVRLASLVSLFVWQALCLCSPSANQLSLFVRQALCLCSSGKPCVFVRQASLVSLSCVFVHDQLIRCLCSSGKPCVFVRQASFVSLFTISHSDCSANQIAAKGFKRRVVLGRRHLLLRRRPVLIFFVRQASLVSLFTISQTSPLWYSYRLTDSYFTMDGPK